MYRVNQTRFTHLVGCKIESMKSTLKLKSISQRLISTRNLAVCKITSHLDLEIRKMLVRGMLWNQDPFSILVHSLLAAEHQIQFLKVTM